jgi:hypothetical protein
MSRTLDALATQRKLGASATDAIQRVAHDYGVPGMKKGQRKMPEVRGQNNYSFTHGKAPRGRGNWAFKHEGGALHGQTTFHSGSFKEATHAARKHGQQHGSHTIHVQT